MSLRIIGLPSLRRSLAWYAHALRADHTARGGADHQRGRGERARAGDRVADRPPIDDRAPPLHPRGLALRARVAQRRRDRALSAPATLLADYHSGVILWRSGSPWRRWPSSTRSRTWASRMRCG